MQTRRLGPTSVPVSQIGYGAMHLSLQGRPDRDHAVRVLHHALDRGVTFIDTADAYCVDESDKHHNERLIRDALDRYDGDADGVVVATKGGLMRPGGDWTPNGTPEHLRETIRESVDALGGPLFLWQHHRPDPDVHVHDSLRPVADAVDEGLIRHVGVSNYTVDQIEQAREVVDVVSVQNQYSPWHRAPEEDGVLTYCTDRDLAFLPWSPMGGQARTKRLDEIDALRALAEARGISPQRLVIAWLLHRSPAIVPIPGTTDPSHLDDVLAAADVELSDDEMARMDAASAEG